jgi:hypothetical protein
MEDLDQHRSQETKPEPWICDIIRIIAANAGTEALLRIGLSYSQIGRGMYECIQRGFVADVDGRLIVTDSGRAVLRSREVNGVERRDGGWIRARDEDRGPRLGLFDVYLPTPRVRTP